ncbi:MAG TPA: uracil-DNA glycosylase [Nocardioides sp.]|uniref:uracil-DNA glycosylase n=1 Tax=Nocardioides sp. TaxID=35761 RepID=UPI002CC955DF|nr:uracil-DNA glycosylase [Nocardioides sp.]HQR28472.1 uracil-DNA glycosylase [Nocardioides sp.]
MTAPGPALPHPVTGEPFPSPVPPGTGWPDDPASPDTPVARTAADVAGVARESCGLDPNDRSEADFSVVWVQSADARAARLAELGARTSVCRACPRLVEWREEVARTKRASFADQPYWGRPVAGWGDAEPRVLIVGLAPAANGGNRTGRVFTGDSSGDWLYASLHRVGLAALPTSTHAGDGQALLGARLVAAVRCAPPANRPSTTERDTCAAWLAAELALVAPTVRVVVALGGFAWDAVLRAAPALGCAVPRPRPRFGHGLEVGLPRAPGAWSGLPGDSLSLLGCYHPSQQNTFTGRLTVAMLDEVLGRAAASR